MGFFSTRERAEPNTSVEMGVEGKGRESVRHDFAPPQRPREDGAAGDLDSLMLRVAKAALHRRSFSRAKEEARKSAWRERARAREIIEYAKLSQSAVQSIQIITQRLSSLKKVPGASVMSEPHVEDISNEEHRASNAEVFTQHIKLNSPT